MQDISNYLLHLYLFLRRWSSAALKKATMPPVFSPISHSPFVPHCFLYLAVKISILVWMLTGFPLHMDTSQVDMHKTAFFNSLDWFDLTPEVPAELHRCFFLGFY